MKHRTGFFAPLFLKKVERKETLKELKFGVGLRV